MLNKKVVIGFILSLVLMFSLCNIASAVEMGMDKDKAADELQKNRPKNCQRIIDLGGDIIEVEYNNSIHFLDRYYYASYMNNKIERAIKYYNKDCHEQLLPSMIKAYGKPAADYYGKKDGSDEHSIQKIKSMSKKDSDKLIKKKDLERRTLWENKKEYIILLSYSNGTYVMRFWKGIYREWPVGGGNDFRVFIEN